SSTWLYYQKPVQNYLRGLGCPDQDIEDITHDVLIRLETHILLNYDPARPFRPYFKTAVRNFYFSHLRSKVAVADASGTVDANSDKKGDSSDLSGLVEYAEQAYDHFAIEAPEQLATGIRMLQSWILEGQKQEMLAATWKLTDRQVRTHLANAADALAEWMSKRINPGDLEDLVAAASSTGMAGEASSTNLRSLFTHLSKQKRMRTLWLLALIYRQKTAHGAPSSSTDPTHHP
nr:hypothetical protein [Planctomycetota bacterium]